MVATSTVKAKASEGIWDPAERRAEPDSLDKGIRCAGVFTGWCWAGLGWGSESGSGSGSACLSQPLASLGVE